MNSLDCKFVAEIWKSIVIKNNFLLLHSEYGEEIHAQVKIRYTQFDHELDIFLVSLSDSQATEIIIYDTITKVLDMQLQRKSELEDKGQFLLFCDIIDHRLIK